jgi:hypothetical protein
METMHEQKGVLEDVGFWDMGHTLGHGSCLHHIPILKNGFKLFHVFKNNSPTEFIMKVSNGTSKKLGSTIMK